MLKLHIRRWVSYTKSQTLLSPFRFQSIFDLTIGKKILYCSYCSYVAFIIWSRSDYIRRCSYINNWHFREFDKDWAQSCRKECNRPRKLHVWKQLAKIFRNSAISFSNFIVKIPSFLSALYVIPPTGHKIWYFFFQISISLGIVNNW